MTTLSKATLACNVVLAASEHAEPFRLRALGYDPTHMTQMIFMSEVPPEEMATLLMDKWGMGSTMVGLVWLDKADAERWKNYVVSRKSFSLAGRMRFPPRTRLGTLSL